VIRHIFGYISSLWDKARGLLVKSKKLQTVWVDDMPDTVDQNCVYVVGEGKYLWYVGMKCPCGCGSVLQMSLIKGKEASWTLISHDNGTISLHPSILRKIGCRSHFFLRNSIITWSSGRNIDNHFE